MLIDLDESLYHQTTDPMAMAMTSDHRFFDRYWFSGVDPAGDVAFFAGLGRYTNMGTRDAFLNVVTGNRQYNLRAALQDPAEPHGTGGLTASVGPLQVAVHEPFRRIGLQATTARIAADLVFTSAFPAHLEAKHREIRAGRVVQENQRYDQVGRWSGSVEVDGRRIEVADWWGDRDHSWGVRVDVGGLEPPDLHRRGASFTAWCNFSTDDCVGLFQLREYTDGRPRYVDGRLHRLDGGIARSSRCVVDIHHDVEFHPGTTVYRRAAFRLILEDGSTVEVLGLPLDGRAWVSRGGGYNRGYADGLGFGARRGDVVEHDVYDLPDDGQVLLDGVLLDPGHRERLARVTVDGRPGTAHLPVIPRSGDMPEPPG